MEQCWKILICFRDLFADPFFMSLFACTLLDVGDAGCILKFSFWGIGQDRQVSFKNFFLTFHNFLAGSPCFLLKIPSINFLQRLPQLPVKSQRENQTKVH
jgi:hypothetical protein